ncbi:hypothetical protein ONZ45_g9938 [Pleurotus djamor]|nr:hypothetical protein ONZ45_g9938 [Pleurotus djamor]
MWMGLTSRQIRISSLMSVDTAIIAVTTTTTILMMLTLRPGPVEAEVDDGETADPEKLRLLYRESGRPLLLLPDIAAEAAVLPNKGLPLLPDADVVGSNNDGELECGDPEEALLAYLLLLPPLLLLLPPLVVVALLSL